MLTVSRTGVVLAFDQSLARTGWALLDASTTGQTMKVLKVGMLPTEPGDVTGFEDSFQRGVALYEMASSLISEHVPSVVVHEMPAVQRGQSRNREAPFVSAMAIRCACYTTRSKVVMLNAQHVRKRLVGSAKAEKKDVRESLIGFQILEGVTRSELDYWNSDVFDAMALAVVYATQEGK
jgi:Holliday junction resolvasome RuvABC endonuclease subunit